MCVLRRLGERQRTPTCHRPIGVGRESAARREEKRRGSISLPPATCTAHTLSHCSSSTQRRDHRILRIASTASARPLIAKPRLSLCPPSAAKAPPPLPPSKESDRPMASIKSEDGSRQQYTRRLWVSARARVVSVCVVAVAAVVVVLVSRSSSAPSPCLLTSRPIKPKNATPLSSRRTSRTTSSGRCRSRRCSSPASRTSRRST